MTHTTEPMTLEQALSIIDEHHGALLSAGNYTGEGSWFHNGDEKEFKEEYQQARSVIKAELAKQREAEPVAWLPMNTAPRDGTVIVLRFGEDGESPGWFDSPAHPIKNEDGTWPDNPYGHPWAFIDKRSEIKHGEDVGAWFVNHARDTEYGPTHWRPYAHPQQRNAVEVTEDDVSIAVDAVDGHYCRHDMVTRTCVRIILESYRSVLSAVASRDREDAE